MRTRENLLAGIAIGSGLMYLLDPNAGRRRRALARDKAGKWSRKTGRAFETGYIRASNKMKGVSAEIRRAREGERTDDEAVAQRIRQCIARHSTHPKAIDVAVTAGVVTLSGPILQADTEPVLRCASKTKGVEAVNNRLDVHEEPGDVPGLQGEPHRRPVTARLMDVMPTWGVGTGALAAGLAAFFASRSLAHRA